jgi:hypothetical protein
VLGPEPGTEVAVNTHDDVVFWLDPAGVARTADL